MNQVFLSILNNTLTASWLIAAILILRIFLKKAPKWITCSLWGLAAIRLVLPFQLESIFSLIPSAEVVPADIEYSVTPQIDTGVRIVDHIVNPVIETYFTPDPAASVNPLQIWISVLSILWIVGIVALLCYAFVSYLMLKRKVSASIQIQKKEKIYECDDIKSPFILGVFRPGIYLPSGLDEVTKECVLAHERTHIKRGDHFWKPLGFLILSVYWFHPLCWVAFILLCRDIEYACDERATKHMEKERRADYCQALLDCSVHRKMIAACPVAFGEAGVKERIKSVLNYKKPAFWMIVIAIMACVVVSVCFMTNPAQKIFLKDVEPEELQRIIVFDGNTGQEFVITDEDELTVIVENIQSISVKREKLSLGYSGYRFHMTFVDTTGETITEFILNSEGLIRKDPFFYTSEGGFCYDYIDELERKYTGNMEQDQKNSNERMEALRINTVRKSSYFP